MTSAVDELRNDLSGSEDFGPQQRSYNQRQSRNEKQHEFEQTTMSKKESDFIPWRVFINCMDSYHGKQLTELLPTREYYVDTLRQRDDILGSEGSDTKDETGNEEKTKKKRKKIARDYESDEMEQNEGETDYLSEGNPETPRRKLEIVGTVKDQTFHRPEDVAMVIRSTKNKELLLGELMKCGVVIYDITQDDSQIAEACWALEAIVEELEKVRRETPKAFERNKDVRYFILISTLMTWALTKPLDPEDPNLPYNETDYRKRKPHPNFKQHIKCEREVSTIAKRTKLDDKLKTVVLGTGVTYGDEEGPLHYLFKMAWNNAEYLPIFGRGNNKIPLLDVRDLAKVIAMLVETWPKSKYIVAAEQELVSQATIIKKISKALTTGKVKHLMPEEAFLLSEVTQRSYDIINANINIEPAYIVDNQFQWHWELPFRDNIYELVKEYKISRNLLPVKIIVLGPPASGKTKIAPKLSEHYGIHYIHVKDLIAQTIQKLSREIEASSGVDGEKEESAKEELEDVEEGDESDNDDDDDDGDSTQRIEMIQEQLDEIRNNMAKNNGRLDDDILNKILRKRLMSKDCQNQGYVIDGYPKTLSQAKDVFGLSGDDEEDERNDDDIEEASTTDGYRKIMPELVVVLEADDEFLIERVIRLPEKEIQQTHYNEEGMLRRLREYRERNTDEESPLEFFDEMEVHPLLIPIEDDTCPDMFSTFIKCIQRLGEPRNYGPSDVEREAMKKRIVAEAFMAEAIEKARKERENYERKMARERKMMEWTDLLEKLKQEEETQLCIMTEPLRHYLVKYIFPTLTQGLTELARLRPDDPIDFLAEFLFKMNPEGKMFEPDYTETMSMLLDEIEKLHDGDVPLKEFDKGTEKYLKREGQRDGHWASGRSASKDGTTVLTDDDACECQQDENKATTNCNDQEPFRSIKTSTITSSIHTNAVKSDEKVESGFSYEDNDEDVQKSFGNSTILSRENSL